MAISITATNLEATRSAQTVRWFAANNPAVITVDGSGAPASDYVQIQLRDEAGTGTLATLKPIALDSNTEAKVDLSGVLNSLLGTSDDSSGAPTAAISTARTDKFLRFRIYYRDDTGAYSDSGTVYTAVQAVRQIGDTSTLETYVALGSGSPITLDASGAFLTGFTTPVVWFYDDVGTRKPIYGSTAFIIGENWATDNFQVSGLGSTIIGNNLDEGVYYVGVNSDIDLTASSGTITLTDTTQSIDLQSITYEIREACQNPVIIKWANDLGGWDVWVFEGKAPVSYDSTTVSSYTKPFDSLGSTTEYNRSFLKEGRQSIELTAYNLTLNEAQQLKRMTQSPHVLLFTGELTDTNYITWTTVNVLDGTIGIYDTYNPRHRFSLSIELPQEFAILG